MSKSTRGQISLRRIFSIFGAVVMPLAQLGFAEGTQRLVKDINPTLRSAAGSFPSELVTSADGPDVIKTWSTDGSGTSLLKDTSASFLYPATQRDWRRWGVKPLPSLST
ncbi:MAG: hypothetical protein DMG09_07325 [Acidobacteria bacterium]|nr:MAG: hypothetical protein DMG09_07325 [Acidobacteriota bacterium]